ncbi:O-antigen polysaccharide polymerase Wzy [Humibacter sp.]|uniref:O-antigen polysaccharide polymerase Wzy n=1 Tax=Humibacter sp. TaxID=1940291 RepID=UPI003F8067D9
MPLVLTESIILVVAGEYSITRILRNGFWSPGSLFFIVLSLFHAGLVLFWMFGLDPGFARPDDYIWYLGDSGTQALVLVLIGMASFVAGCVLLVSIRPSSAIEESRFVPEGRAAHYSSAGAVLTIVGVVTWAIAGLQVGGVAIFFDSYANWLAATSASSTIPLAYAAIGLGIGLTLVAPARRLARLALICFGIFAVVAFLLGLRGEVLFPIAVGASVLAFRRRMPRALVALSAVVVVLILISAVRVIRQIGVSSGSFDWNAADPLSAVGEMGQTIRVVAVVMQWHVQGEAFEHGATYTVSFARFFEQLFDPQNRPPAATDFRLMNSEIMARSGAIGGSVIAEAFHNFAVPGVIVVLLLIGVIFASFSNMTLTPTRVAVYVCVAYPLFGHIRNSFVPVIPTMLFGFLVLLITRVAGDIFTKRRRL